MGAKGGGGIQGYRYSLGLFMGLCRGGIDALLEIKVGNLTAWTGNVTGNTSFSINQPNLFGGDTKEGGIVGTVQVYFGGDDQVLSADVQNSLNGLGVDSAPDDTGEGGGEIVVPSGSGLVSGFRGITTLFYRGLVTSNNPYLKNWKMRVQRILAGWDGDVWQPDLAIIGMVSGQNGDSVDISAMNPAHILYQAATDRLWGRGLDRSLMDEDAWFTAASALKNEGFGLCTRYTRADNGLGDFVQDIVNHIGAAIFIDRSTGLFTIRLIRDDYDDTTLPVLDRNSGLLQITEDDSSSTDTSPNEIIVNWHDPLQDTDRQVRAQNLAGTQATGGALLSVTNSYPAIPTFDLAARVAGRDLKAQANSLKRYTIVTDRRGWSVRPADVFKISDPSRGIFNMIIRVAKIEDSTAGWGSGDGAGNITFTCLQDVFGLPSTSLVKFQPNLWTPPNVTAAAPTREELLETDYRNLFLELPTATLAAFADTSGGIATIASRPVNLSPDYQLNTHTGTMSTAYKMNAIIQWTPSGRLVSNIAEGATSLTLDKGSQWSVVSTPCSLYLDGEWMQCTAFNTTTGVATVVRGCVDTVPAPHASGKYAYFPDRYIGSDLIEYASGETVWAKYCTETTTGVLPLASATQLTVTIARRWFRPYPPGKVKVDTFFFYAIPTFGFTPGDRVISWTHRDRLSQEDSLIGFMSNSVGPEAGTTYTIRIYDQTGTTLIRTTSGLTGTSWTYTAVMQGADVPGHRAVVELVSVRDGLESWQKYRFNIPLIESGWGYTWGYDWGGA